MSEILSNIQEKGKIPTSSPIDSLIGGGVEKGVITQFYGPPGSGKTNIALNILIQNAKTGKNGIFVDTEGGLSIERVKQISGTEFNELASNIIVFEPSTFTEQDSTLRRIEKMVESGEKVELVILDSAVALYRVRDGDSSQINLELGRQMGLLTRLARKHDIAVVITNQVYASFEGEGMVEPVGGTILKYRSKIMVELERGDVSGERYAILKRHRSRAEGLRTRFRIVDNGLI
ncbi:MULTISPECIES: DNA repair and recombination protein RadB [Methanobacterium]|uniref:DNA repair and recombination protein RadB n=1 Tax=Methanobacterium subterraneum TaxID=59277 RepID=A0A7K4DKH6_9EURY|nr:MULTISPECIES: DNA repair and recombination protein RadB [Methanobacterium]AUB57128.1 DNA repair and recombination protein RadB [Methanobacterium sp. MZ-A1]NMO08516.1 DNA repair and recombination protein RadB [Methanobacterium subterraneum]PKL73512.1 MAG: DNA repair and recombination protein RadB [Methanobacteriales archaeon HGW-Methanobacteriales-2]HII83433.1 DNA repair and recombination protein RadB [Methanobacterium subterraneum]